jgi:RNA polymerase sigma factor (TIGR02999 family)
MLEAKNIASAPPQGPPATAAQLLPQLYQELRRLAAQFLVHERPGQTLTATALVHEAYLRLVKPSPERPWDGRNHFIAAAVQAMRRILVENARRKQSLKQGGNLARHDVEGIQLAAPQPHKDVLALNEALDKLAVEDEVKAKLVKLRYFSCLTLEEAATELHISPATAARYWAYARAWLHRQIAEDAQE